MIEVVNGVYTTQFKNNKIAWIIHIPTYELIHRKWWGHSETRITLDSGGL